MLNQSSSSYPYTIDDIDFYKEGFSFVKDPVLLSNCAYTMQHLVFTLQAYEDGRLPGPLKYSLGKEIIIDSASIIEALCHYWIKQKVTFQGFSLDDFFRRKNKLKELKSITIDQQGDEIVAAVKLEKKLISMER